LNVEDKAFDDDSVCTGVGLFLVTLAVVLDDDIVVVIASFLGVVVVLSVLKLLDEGMKHDESAAAADCRAILVVSHVKESCQGGLLLHNVKEFLGLEKVLQDGASVQIGFFVAVRELFDELVHDFQLAVTDLGGQVLIEVCVDDVEEFVENFGDTLLVNVEEKVVEDGAFVVEDVWDHLSLLAVHQKGQQLGEVTSEHWVQWGLLGLNKFEKAVQKHVLADISLLFRRLFDFGGKISVDSGLSSWLARVLICVSVFRWLSLFLLNIVVFGVIEGLSFVLFFFGGLLHLLWCLLNLLLNLFSFLFNLFSLLLGLFSLLFGLFWFRILCLFSFRLFGSSGSLSFLLRLG